MSGSIILVFLPILIVIGALFLLRFVLSRVTLMTPKRVWLFVGGYIVLGLISLIGISMLADDSTKTLSSDKLQQILDENKKVSEFVKEREWESIDEKYVKSNTTYTLATEDFTIDLADGAVHDTRIFASFNDKTTNEIELTYYEMPLIVNGIDLTEKVPPLAIYFDNDRLSITEGAPIAELQYHTFRPVLMGMEVFFEEVSYENRGHLIYSPRILHLNVPRHMNMIDNSGWVNNPY